MNQKRIRTDCMIRDSYQRLIENSEEDALERELKEEIEKIVHCAQTGGDAGEAEQMRDVAFRSAEAGQETGFVRGVRYAFRFFVECL